MKFIFPKNYKFSIKLLGFIDYKTAIFDLIYGILLFLIINLIFNNWNVKIYLFIGLYFPIILFSLFGINNENIVDVIRYFVKYLISPKVILYNKQSKF